MDLAIVRSPSHLTLVRSLRRSGAFVPPGRQEATPLASLFAVERVGLPARSVRRDVAEVAAAWTRLEQPAGSPPAVLADVLLVLLRTVPSAAADGGPLPRLAAPAEAPRASAAHPRAFRGTKRKPPKPEDTVRGDLRPRLDSPAARHDLLASLWPARRAAIRRLQPIGLDAAGLARLAALERPPSDPYLALHHAAAPSRAGLPPGFVERLLPSLAGASWSVLRAAAALHHRLSLDHDESLALLAARALVSSPETALEWLAVLETQPRDRRLAFLALVLETGVLPAHGAIPKPLAVDLAKAPPEAYERWVYAVLDGLVRHVGPAYLAAGIHYAVEYSPEESLWRISDAPGFGESTAEDLLQLLPPGWGGAELMDLWETCAALPGFSAYLQRADWAQYTATQRTCVLRFFMDMRWDRQGSMDAMSWQAMAAWLPRFEERLRAVPPAYTEQYLNDLGSRLSVMTRASEIRERLPLAIDLLARVNRPPFDPNGNAAAAFGQLLKLPAAARDRVLASADQPFLALDKACRRTNAATLVAWGLSSLVEGMPALVADAFRSAPGSLARTARHLGVLSAESRARLVRRCSKRPVFRESLGAAGAAGLVSTIQGEGVAEAAAVVPRALREHLAGRRRLSSAQVDGHLASVRRSLAACRLAVLRSAVDAELAGSVGARSADREALAALAHLRLAQENRRGLRRFLRAWLGGDAEYLIRHPATQDWAKRHPRIDLGLWTRGFDRRIVSNGAELAIRVEQDPLEVLKMGTYVGSCLGLGGGLTYSAAASLLDVNKQVLYARDRRGVVVARQLLAISDADELVSFSVYPESAPPAVEEAFGRYDREFAGKLGIALADPDEPYEIENVLSQSWWDDYATKVPSRKPRHGP